MVVRPAPGSLAVERVGHGVQERLDRAPAGLAILGTLRLDLRAVEHVGPARSASLRLEPGGIVGRVDARRKGDDLHLESLANRELHPTQRCRLAGGIAVEGEPEPLAQPAELAKLVLGERRPHAGDDGLEPGLPEGDHVGVALDDARPVRAGDVQAGEVEAVDDVALLEQLGLGGVHVFRLERVVVVESPGLEAEHAAARVGEREDEAPLEVVAAARARQPDGTKLLDREALLERLPGQRRATDRETEAELPADLLAKAAAGKVVAGERAGLRFPEIALVEAAAVSSSESMPLPARPSPILFGRGFLVLRSDPGAPREPFDRLDERRGPESPGRSAIMSPPLWQPWQ